MVSTGDLVHALQSGGHGASPNNTPHVLSVALRAATGGDRPHVLAPISYAIQAGALRENPTSGPDGVGIQADIAYTIEARAEVQAVAFSCKDHGADASVEIAPTLRAMGYSGSHANGGGQIAVSFKASHYTRGKDGAPSELAPPLSADADKGDQDTLILAPTIFTGDGVVADPISANEAKTYTHEGTTFRLHNCIGEPFAVSFAENSRGELRLEGGDGSRTGALSTGGGKPGQGIPAIAHGVLAFKPGQSEAAGGIFVTDDFAPTLQAQNNGSTAVPAVCITDNTDLAAPGVTAFQERGRADGREIDLSPELAYALLAPSGGSRSQERNVQVGMAVRRLTPRECERLQAFPDDYSLITYRGKPAADGPRYKALGNSMCVNNMRWIGERIEAVLAMPAPAADTQDRPRAGLVLCEDLAVA
jgi:hypothetical protein